MREVHSLILQVGSRIQTGVVTKAYISLQGLGSWEALSKPRPTFSVYGVQMYEVQEEKRRRGNKAFGVWEKLTKPTWALHMGSSNIYEGQGPGAFTHRPHQTYSPAEDPLPLPEP